MLQPICVSTHIERNREGTMSRVNRIEEAQEVHRSEGKGIKRTRETSGTMEERGVIEEVQAVHQVEELEDSEDEKKEKNERKQGNMGIEGEELEVLEKRNRNKLKTAITNLKKCEGIKQEQRKRIVQLFSRWLDELKGDNDEFGVVLRALTNLETAWSKSEHNPKNMMIDLAVELIQREDAIVYDESANAIRNHVKRIIEEYGVEEVVGKWRKAIEE